MTKSLEDFYHEYIPPITSKHHTCVGLGLDLAEKIMELEKTYPGIGSALFLASCEEVIILSINIDNKSPLFTNICLTERFVCGITWKDIGNVNRYVSTPTPDTRTSEKEHVVIALNIELEDRVGVLILDTGYHVPQPVTVMEDGLYPHTGSNICSYVIIRKIMSDNFFHSY